MQKAARRFIYLLLLLPVSCASNRDPEIEMNELKRKTDSLAENAIDSAYSAIKNECDTAMRYLPTAVSESGYIKTLISKKEKIADSTLRLVLGKIMLDSTFQRGRSILYPVEFEKVNKVIKALKDECDTSLLKETYRLVLLKQGSVSPRPASSKKRHG
jgi:hypothetical protein